jgi:glycosyltransferase involved in cell wall biosynthesis
MKALVNQKLIRVTTISMSLNILLKGQLAFLNKYYNVIGVASGSEGLGVVAERENIRTIEIEMQREICLLADLKSLFIMLKVFHREKPFIVHANTPKGSLLSMIAAWVCRVPHRIYTVTGLRFETASGKFRRLLIGMEKITCFCATKVIPEGDGVKRTLIRENITKKPLRKILNGNINGIDLNHFTCSNEVISKAKEIRGNNILFTFCFVGRMVLDKGINELVQAFVKLNKKYPDIRLLLVGPFEKKLCPLSNEVESLIFNHKRILFVNYQDDVRPYFAASDVFVFPSYREGFPNVVMQAGAMGLPCIVTDINGCNEIIENGVNGIIIPPKDSESLYNAMVELYQNKQKREKMADIAREMISSRYDQQLVWDALLKEYQSLENDI